MSQQAAGKRRKSIRVIRPAGVFMLLVMICLLLINPLAGLSQQKQKPAKEEPAVHSISKAALYSAVLPGLGQAYNRKYWKIPIIYAGFGVIGYFVWSNNKEYRLYQEAYVYTANGDTTPTGNPYIGRYNLTQLQDAMDFYRRNRDLAYIIGGVWYVANILEAYVDAHFFEYDISEDITMKISPAISPLPLVNRQSAAGIKVAFKF